MTIRDLKRKDIKEYAKGAIEELERQLASATTESRKVKLISRIEAWKREPDKKAKADGGFGIIFLIFLAAAIQVAALQVVNWANKPSCTSGFRLESGHCVGEIKVTEARK